MRQTNFKSQKLAVVFPGITGKTVFMNRYKKSVFVFSALFMVGCSTVPASQGLRKPSSETPAVSLVVRDGVLVSETSKSDTLQLYRDPKLSDPYVVDFLKDNTCDALVRAPDGTLLSVAKTVVFKGYPLGMTTPVDDARFFLVTWPGQSGFMSSSQGLLLIYPESYDAQGKTLQFEVWSSGSSEYFMGQSGGSPIFLGRYKAKVGENMIVAANITHDRSGSVLKSATQGFLQAPDTITGVPLRLHFSCRPRN